MCTASRVAEAIAVWAACMLTLSLSSFMKVEGYVEVTIVAEASLAGPALIYLYLRRGVISGLLTKVEFPTLIQAVVVSLIVWGVGSALSIYLDTLFPPPNWRVERVRQLIPRSPEELIVALSLTWTIVAPVEEVIFRGILLKPLMDSLGVKTGVILSSIIFSISHLDPWNMIPPFLMGLAAGWLVSRGGGILSAILVHGLYNSLTHVVNHLSPA